MKKLILTLLAFFSLLSSAQAAGLARHTNTSETQIAFALVHLVRPGRRTRTVMFPGRPLMARVRNTSTEIPSAHSQSGTPSSARIAQIMRVPFSW